MRNDIEERVPPARGQRRASHLAEATLASSARHQPPGRTRHSQPSRRPTTVDASDTEGGET